MHGTQLEQNLLKLILRVPCLLAPLVALDNRDNIMWLALFEEILLASIKALVIVPFASVVVIAIGELLALLVLLIRLSLYHVAELHDCLGSSATEVTVDVKRGEVILIAVDHVLIGDVGDGCTSVEEVPGVGP